MFSESKKYITHEYTIRKAEKAYSAFKVFLLNRPALGSDMALFESLTSAQHHSRFSIVGIIPCWKIVSPHNPESDPLMGIYSNFRTGEQRRCNWLHELDNFVRLFGDVSSPQLGVMGYIGYEKRHCFEDLRHNTYDDTHIPDLYFVYYSLMYWVDHREGSAYWVYENSVSARELAEVNGRMRRSETEHEAEQSAERTENCFFLKGDVHPDFTQSGYVDKVNQTISYIRRGDVFQANIAERFHGDYSGDPIHLYERLRQENPNPYFAFLDFKSPIISTSPERFFVVEGTKINVMPIKGTKKIDSRETKEKARTELALSSKDRAENCMIVDLMRNDISKICRKGSVHVSELCNVIERNNVFHLESHVHGTLRADISCSDILRALFPGGSVTGAPKIRAMDIIAELEEHQRKAYCGCIAFFGAGGYIDTSVAIRILQFSSEQVYFYAGGGIVVDSQAEDEYVELEAKVAHIKRCLVSFDILGSYRRSIDNLDARLLALLADRFSIIREVAAFKKKHNVAVVQKQRMQNVVEERVALAREMGISEELVRRFYTDLVDCSTNLEELLQRKKGNEKA